MDTSLPKNQQPGWTFGVSTCRPQRRYSRARARGRSRNDAAIAFTFRSHDRLYTLRRARASGLGDGGIATLRSPLYQGLLARVGLEWARTRRHEQPTRRAGARHARAAR